MRLIDAKDYLYCERPVGLSDELYQESHLYKSIMEQEVIQAIPLDDVKQAREEISEMRKKHNVSVTDCLDILDKLIAESEK